MLVRLICALFLLVLPPLARAQDSTRTIERYREFVEQRPGPGLPLDRLWGHFDAQGKTQELIAQFRERADVGEAAAGLVLGHLLEKSGDREAARVAFQKVADQAPADARPWKALAGVELAAGNSEAEARAWEEAAARTEPGEDQTATLLAGGKAWVRAGKVEAAARLWQRAVTQRPDDPVLHRQLGEAYATAGKTDEAVAHFEVLAKTGDPYERITALREMARLYQVEGRGDEAIATLRRALPLAAAGNWLRDELTGELIRLHQRLGRVNELEEAWQTEASEHPRDRSRWLQLIELYHLTAQPDREREALVRLVTLMPEETIYRLRLARLLERQNRLPEAAAEFDRLLARGDGDLDLQLARADLELRLGNPSAAVARLRPLAAESPENRDRVLAFLRENRLAGPEEELLRQRLEAEPTEERVLELAEFLFGQSREQDAIRTLHLLLDLGPKDESATRWARLAEVLQDKDRPVEAVRALQRALTLEPRRPEWTMRLAGLQKTLGEKEAALATARRAVMVADAPPDPAVDERYHQLLSDAVLPGTSGSDGRTSPAPEASQKASFRSFLEGAAGTGPTVAKHLRLARWLLLERDYPAAFAAAQAALRLDGSDAEARQLALRIADAAGLYAEAIDLLEQLAEADPDRAEEYRRRIPEMHVRAGRVDEGLAGYAELLGRAPGDFVLLTAQARTLQGAERWLEALEAWRKAWVAGSLPERRALLPTMLQILQRLGHMDAALDLQLQMLDRETDPRSRETLLRDLMRMAGEKGRSAYVLEEIRRRIQGRPQDAFLQIALARALETEGRESEALSILRDASFATAEPEPLLESIVTLADGLGRYELAIETQQRLIWSRAALRADDFVRLAELQAQWLDLVQARTTWEEVVSRFGSDSDVLKKAAGFFLRWQYREPALATLQKLRRTDPDDRAALLTLAELSAAAGETGEALSAAEEILQSTAPRPDAVWRFPESRSVDAGKLQQSYFRAAQLRRGMPDADVMQEVQAFWSGRGNDSARRGDRRLDAIRLVAELRAAESSGGRLQSWLRQWDRASASPIETLWAAYYAGDEERVMRELVELLGRNSQDLKVHQAFVWLTLQMGRYDDLRPWLEQTRGRGAQYRDVFAVAFTQFLNEASADEVTQAVQSLFPEEERSRLLIWQTATQLAAQSHFHLAADLAGRLLEQGGGVAQFAAEIGSWHAHAGEAAKAREVWAKGAEGEGEAFDDLRYENLRRHLLTLSGEELNAFADQAEKAEDGSPIHRGIVRVLANGLCRREAAAKRALDELIAMRPLTSDTDGEATWRYWRFVLTAGVQMQMWGMNRLAVHLWGEATDDAATLALVEGVAGAVTSEIELREFGAGLLEMPPEAVGHAMSLFRARSTADARAVFASLLEWVGQFRHGVEAMRALLQHEPKNLAYLRTLLNVAGPGNVETVRECAKAGLARLVFDPATAQLTLQYLDYFTRARAFDSAHAVLDDLGEAVQTQPDLLERRAQLYAMQERWEEAAAAYAHLRELSGGSTAHALSHAEALRRLGRIDEAIALFSGKPSKPGGSPSSPHAKLAELHLENGDISAAIRSARALIGEGATPELRPLAAKFLEKGERRFAQVLLYGIAPASGDFGGQFWNEATALELADAETQGELRSQGMARLEAAAMTNPELRPFHYQALEKLLPSRSAYLERLRTDWTAGIEVAGDVLVATAAGPEELPEGFAARATAAQLSQLSRRERARGRLAPAAELMALALAKQPRQDDWRFELIDDLIALDRKQELPAHFEIVRTRSALNGSLLAPLAEAMARAGQRDEARTELERVTEWDTAGNDPASLLAYARLLLQDGERSLASLYLRRAYQNTRTSDYAGAVEYLRSLEAGGDRGAAMVQIGLDAVQQRAVLKALEAPGKTATP